MTVSEESRRLSEDVDDTDAVDTLETIAEDLVSTIIEDEEGVTGMAAGRTRTLSLAIVYVTVLIDVMGFGIIIPLIPFFVLTHGASALWLGFIFSSFSICNFFGSIVLGRISDRYGRKPVLLLGLFGSVIGQVFFGLSTHVWMLCMSRALSGLCGGTVGVAQAYVADCTSPKERSKFMGILGACMGIGLVLGPALGGTLYSFFGFSIACFVAAGISAINFTAGIFLLKESSRRRSSQPLTLKIAAAIMSKRSIIVLCACNFLSMFGLIGFEVTFALLAADHFKSDSFFVGLTYTSFGVVMAVVQGLFSGPLKRLLGEKKTALLATFLEVGTIPCFPFMPNLPILFVTLIIFSLWHGMFQPTMPSMISLNTPESHYGFVMGVYASCSSIARIVSPPLYGMLYDVSYQAPSLLSAAFMFATFSLLWLVQVPQTNVETLEMEKGTSIPLVASEKILLDSGIDEDESSHLPL